MTPKPDDKELERHLAELGLRPKHIENTTTTHQSKKYPEPEKSDWYKQGKECPF